MVKGDTRRMQKNQLDGRYGTATVNLSNCNPRIRNIFSVAKLIVLKRTG